MYNVVVANDKNIVNLGQVSWKRVLLLHPSLPTRKLFLVNLFYQVVLVFIQDLASVLWFCCSWLPNFIDGFHDIKEYIVRKDRNFFRGADHPFLWFVEVILKRHKASKEIIELDCSYLMLLKGIVSIDYVKGYI